MAVSKKDEQQKCERLSQGRTRVTAMSLTRETSEGEVRLHCKKAGQDYHFVLGVNMVYVFKIVIKIGLYSATLNFPTFSLHTVVKLFGLLALPFSLVSRCLCSVMLYTGVGVFHLF